MIIVIGTTGCNDINILPASQCFCKSVISMAYFNMNQKPESFSKPNLPIFGVCQNMLTQQPAADTHKIRQILNRSYFYGLCFYFAPVIPDVLR